jgi:hypothetical protein
VYVPFHARL